MWNKLWGLEVDDKDGRKGLDLVRCTSEMNQTTYLQVLEYKTIQICMYGSMNIEIESALNGGDKRKIFFYIHISVVKGWEEKWVW